MIVGVDTGATKTLIGLFDDNGKTIATKRLATSHDYDTFVDQLSSEIKQITSGKESISGINLAMPARINRATGVAAAFGNISWKNVPIVHDLEAKFPDAAIRIENDAKSACLYEASEHPDYSRVLYITVSTGIGIGFTVNGKLATGAAEAEAGFFEFISPDSGKLETWDSFASGKALFERTGQKARDIEDPDIWLDQARRLALGLQHIFSILQPQLCLFGGSVGEHFHKYEKQLNQVLSETAHPGLVETPLLKRASEPNDAVLLGTFLMGRS